MAKYTYKVKYIYPEDESRQNEAEVIISYDYSAGDDGSDVVLIDRKKDSAWNAAKLRAFAQDCITKKENVIDPGRVRIGQAESILESELNT